MLSEKQLKIFAFKHTSYDALICSGSVRSGKTSMMTIAFMDWAMENFDKTNFAICGKTVGSCIKNVVEPYLSIKYHKNKGYLVKFTRSDNKIVINFKDKTNIFYLYGGRDNSSYSLIQGITLGGVLFDEVALMPRSFVEQAIARCSITGSKFWFNCNPEHPHHWFYLEWIQKATQKNALYLHFTMNDNPSLTTEILERYERMYAGVFYDRYILGKWVVAEGLIYSMFDKKNHVVPTEYRKYSQYYVSCDYGTMNPMVFGLWGLFENVWYRIKEYYYSGRENPQKAQKTDEDYYRDLVDFLGDVHPLKIIVDPSASSFIACIKSKSKYTVEKAVNNVENGIQNVASMLKTGGILFNDCCKNSIDEFLVYAWDEKKGIDTPIKSNDHCMDDIRYFVNTIIYNKKTVKVYNFKM